MSTLWEIVLLMTPFIVAMAYMFDAGRLCNIIADEPNAVSE